MDVCTPPIVSPPRSPIPPGACDTHTHVFGPFDRFPPQHPSVYALPLASRDEHAKAMTALGVSRGVVVQPGPYGDNPAALLAALTSSSGKLRGIAVAGVATSASELQRWSTAGVRGLRFVEMRAPGGQRYPGSVGFDAVFELAPVMRAAGLHVQLWGTPEQLIAAIPRLLDLDLPIVVDHMGMVAAERGLDDPATRGLLRLLSHKNVWIKLTVCRVARDAHILASLQPIHRAMVEIAAGRALWGSDWPYVRMNPAPDAGTLLELFFEWVDDAALRRAILVDNPSRLFGFDPMETNDARA